MDSQDTLICAPEHSVQFYEDDTFLIDQLGRFIEAGLQAGESAIVLATKAHRDQLENRFIENRFKFHRSMPSYASDRYIVLDAAGMLSEIMTEGGLNAARFIECVGGLIDRAARAGSGRVRIFGELVALLWTSGQGDAALQLEQFWNTLARAHSFSLFCAYPIRGFSHNEHTEGFQDICAAHSIVRPAESFLTQQSTELVNRVVAQLQQKAHALETEVGRRKQIEITLRRREEELADFLENGTECLHQVGPDGRILWANKAELDLLGYQADEYIGHHIAEFHVDADTIADILRRLLGGETLHDYPARLRGKNGSVRDVLIHSNARWEEGAFHYTRCFTRDITERKRVEEELDRRVEERTRDLVYSQHQVARARVRTQSGGAAGAKRCRD